MYDCIIIGGGIAGLQAAIQLGRYRHKVLVVDKGGGRSTLCLSYNNILGWPDGVAGPELRKLGRQHASQFGVEFIETEVIAVSKEGDTFEVMLSAGGGALRSRTLLAATGVTDNHPELAGLVPCLGRTVFVCPDCDGYETTGKRTAIMGAGAAGASVANALSYWCSDLIYINHDGAAIGSGMLDKLQQKGIEYVEEAIDRIEAIPASHGRVDTLLQVKAAEEKGTGRGFVKLTPGGTSSAEAVEVSGMEEASCGLLRGVWLKSGRFVQAERGFIAFGGNKVHTNLFQHLGVERLENGHIVTDPRSKQTSVPGLWAAGDVGIHSEQAVVAMGEGHLAAIWIHKALVKPPLATVR